MSPSEAPGGFDQREAEALQALIEEARRRARRRRLGYAMVALAGLVTVALGLFVVGGERGAESSPPQKPALAPIAADTEVTLVVDAGRFYHGSVTAREEACEAGRHVVLFQRLPGPDRRLGTATSPESGLDQGKWGLWLDPRQLRRGNVYAELLPSMVDGLQCGGDRSKVLSRPRETD